MPEKTAVALTYKGHEITRSLNVYAPSGRPLYAIHGRFRKSAAMRPFLTSRQQCRDWINEQIVADAMGAATL